MVDENSQQLEIITRQEADRLFAMGPSKKEGIKNDIMVGVGLGGMSVIFGIATVGRILSELAYALSGEELSEVQRNMFHGAFVVSSVTLGIGCLLALRGAYRTYNSTREYMLNPIEYVKQMCNKQLVD